MQVTSLLLEAFFRTDAALGARSRMALSETGEVDLFPISDERVGFGT